MSGVTRVRLSTKWQFWRDLTGISAQQQDVAAEICAETAAALGFLQLLVGVRFAFERQAIAIVNCGVGATVQMVLICCRPICQTAIAIRLAFAKRFR